jgi:hypothetical protein
MIVRFSASIISIWPVIGWASCTTEKAALPENNVRDSVRETSALMKDAIEIIIGEKHFTAILEATAAANEFKKMLPLSINMKDLNSNEKFFDFSNDLPANAASPRTINAGDIMLWGSNTLVLFYKTFTTSYSYTRLGKIENPRGLSQALGSGSVTVTFELLAN